MSQFRFMLMAVSALGAGAFSPLVAQVSDTKAELMPQKGGALLESSQGETEIKGEPVSSIEKLVDGENSRFVPFQNFAEPINDLRIHDELRSGYKKLAGMSSKAWNELGIKEIPRQCELAAPISEESGSLSLERAVHATGIVVGERLDGRIWTAGGVFVSADGHFVTNHHVVGRRKQPIAVMTTDGKFHRATVILAAEKKSDVALIRVEGSNFPFVGLAPQAPEGADGVVLIHHSEGRFYTYDRGHVRRHSLMNDATYMEISAEYAIGGSGCGVFNRDHELIGLVSTIGYGLGQPFSEPTTVPVSSEEDEDGGEPGLIILMRMASSWESLRSLWK